MPLITVSMVVDTPEVEEAQADLVTTIQRWRADGAKIYDARLIRVAGEGTSVSLEEELVDKGEGEE